MAYVLGEPTVQQYFDANGDPLVNGTIEFYLTGTSTPTSIYSDSSGTAIGTSVTLNSLGAPANSGTAVALFFDDSITYKIVRKDSAGIEIAPTIDPYSIPRLEDNLKTSFGAVGDDSTDDTAAVLAWITSAMTTGKKAVAPAGTYVMDSLAITTMTGNIEIECDKNAIFKYRTAESTPLFSFSHTSAGVYGVNWKGGVVDNSGGSYNPSSQSNTAIELINQYNYSVKDVHIKGESTYDLANTTTTGTDSGITTVNCSKGTITGNTIEGQGDAGIYLSGGGAAASTDDGGDTIITGNHFIQCWQGITMKRDVARTLVFGNTYTDCRTGVIAVEADSSGVTIDPGGTSMVYGNFFKRIETRAVEVRVNNHFKVFSNIVEDFGFQADGTTISGTPYAFVINGSDNCEFYSNTVYQKDWVANAVTGLHGLYINEVTVNSVAYTPNSNRVHDNEFHNVQFGITEATSGQNTYRDNTFGSTVTTDYNSLDATTLVVGGGGLSQTLTAAKTVTVGETGTTFYLNAAGGFAVTLPIPHVGLRYTFIVKTAPTTAYTVGSDSGDNEMTVKILDIVGELTHATTRDVVTFVAGTSVVGDRLEVECDGTNWNCIAFSGADGGITTAST